jgi:hypothetical protein
MFAGVGLRGIENCLLISCSGGSVMAIADVGNDRATRVLRTDLAGPGIGGTRRLGVNRFHVQ